MEIWQPVMIVAQKQSLVIIYYINIILIYGTKENLFGEEVTAEMSEQNCKRL